MTVEGADWKRQDLNPFFSSDWSRRQLDQVQRLAATAHGVGNEFAVEGRGLAALCSGQGEQVAIGYLRVAKKSNKAAFSGNSTSATLVQPAAVDKR